MKNPRNRVVQILMDRDNLTKQEAVEQVNKVRKMLYEVIESGNYDEAEDVMYSELGLEMDYIDDILF